MRPSSFSDKRATLLPSRREAKPAELLELEQSYAPVVPEVVDTALKFLLEEPKIEDKTEAASAEVGRRLTD
ncbi:hypothetical protein PAMP_015548 [Pampus punctatissimus]